MPRNRTKSAGATYEKGLSAAGTSVWAKVRSVTAE